MNNPGRPMTAGAFRRRRPAGAGIVALAAAAVLGLASPAAAAAVAPAAGTEVGDYPVFVTNFQSNTVTDIGPSWHLTLPVGAGPISVAFTPDGRRAYVLNNIGDPATFQSSVSVIAGANTAHPTVSATFPLNTPLDGGNDIKIVVTPNGKYAWVESSANSEAIELGGVHTGHLTEITRFGEQFAPEGLAVTPNGEYLYVPNGDGLGSSLGVVSEASSRHPQDGGQILVDQLGTSPHAIAVTPDGKHAYVLAGFEQPDGTVSSGVSIINGASTGHPSVSGAVLNLGNLGTGFTAALAITPDGNHAYVPIEGENTVRVIDGVSTANPSVSGTILTVGNNPDDVAITPDGQFAYVPNVSDNTVSVIDGASTAHPSVSGTPLTVGDQPSAVAVSPVPAT
jgi:DNA-binding beta-propeller fold protein YncE